MLTIYPLLMRCLQFTPILLITILLAFNVCVVVVATMMIPFSEEFDPGVQPMQELGDAVQSLVEDLRQRFERSGLIHVSTSSWCHQQRQQARLAGVPAATIGVARQGWERPDYRPRC